MIKTVYNIRRYEDDFHLIPVELVSEFDVWLTKANKVEWESDEFWQLNKEYNAKFEKYLIGGFSKLKELELIRHDR